MFEFPIYIPIKTLDPGSENIMWTINPHNQFKFIVSKFKRDNIK